jgi:transcription elongation GreA/GreB family factor
VGGRGTWAIGMAGLVCCAAMNELKAFFVEELKRHYREVIGGARDAETQTAEAASTLQGESRSKEDRKGAAEFGRMSTAHRSRRERAKSELEVLIKFSKSPSAQDGVWRRIGVGAMVDVSVESDEDSEERTLFLLPVGAGTELKGPGGDGFVGVITPASPVGRALCGAEVGDTVEVAVKQRDREWTVVDIY